MQKLQLEQHISTRPVSTERNFEPEDGEIVETIQKSSVQKVLGCPTAYSPLEKNIMGPALRYRRARRQSLGAFEF
jgi:hypothetical protein